MHVRAKHLILFALFFQQFSAIAAADSPPEWDRRDSIKHGWIYDDFEAGLKKANETGKPMMVVLRCPP